MGGKTGGRPDDRGFVLVPVLLIALLIAAAAAAFIASSRASLLAQRNLALAIAAESIADGAIHIELSRMSGTSYSGSGDVTFCKWGDQALVALTSQDQGGLVDINTASPALMISVLRGVMKDEAQAQIALRALEDFKDADKISSDGSTEPDLYPSREHGPKNAPFAVAEELNQVPGFDGQRFKKLSTLATVQSQQPGIDLDAAPAELKKLLEGQHGADLSQFASPSAKKAFAVIATARLTNGTQFSRHVLVLRTQQPDRPIAVLQWDRVRQEINQWPEPVSLGNCIN